jgi:hypothetical protein
VEASRGEAHRLGGLGEEAAAGFVGPRHRLEPLAVDLRVGTDALPFVACGLDGPGRGDPAGDLGRAFRGRRKDEIGCESRKSPGFMSGSTEEKCPS